MYEYKLIMDGKTESYSSVQNLVDAMEKHGLETYKPMSFEKLEDNLNRHAALIVKDRSTGTSGGTIMKVGSGKKW